MNVSIFALFFAALTHEQLPFSVDATENVSAEFPGAPRVQSFSFAQWKGRWVIIGGRAAGYHSVGGGPAEFLKTDANRDVWVIDTTVNPARSYHAPLDSLPANLTTVKDQWAATGQLYFQDGAKLYIAGGYGQDHAGKWVTFPVISQVDLPSLIDGLTAGKLPAASIVYTRTPLVESTGGELIKLSDGYFYLVMGHSFQGSYTAFEGQSEHDGEEASQKYLNEIRKLKISDAHGKLEVTLAETFVDEMEFHRRDLNVAPILSPKGLGLAAYGGVFTPETQLNYTKPVYLFGDSKPVVDASFEQKMNAYACARLLLYDKAAGTMYTTLFGGISRYSWDAAAGQFVENAKSGTKVSPAYLDGLQWSDEISTIERTMTPGRETTREMVHAKLLPAYMGTDAVFVPATDLARAYPGTDILDLESFGGNRTLVGYVYGGIRASPHRFPYTKTAPAYNAGTVPTQPSDLILKVYVEPHPTGSSAKPFKR
ncbi:MAG: hypothetical protein JOZ22_21265 [Acidobacteriia bacterium]|nr:hypothetical protein [Terriglobia bacterium]